MGRTILITGASGAIGAAIAWSFAAGGNQLALGYHRNAASAQQLCQALQQQGVTALACQADVSNAAQVEAMFAQAQQALGPVDVLVNNAGIAQQKLFCDITEHEWRRMMDVHATGAFLCCRHALPSMIHRKAGCIINVASVWGQTGASCEVHYSAAKAALIGLTKALAMELGPSGIRVNAVAPGVIDTAMLAHFSAEEKQDLAQQAALGRLGTPQDVAEAVHFLASDAAAFMTGQVLAPNGGLYI